MTTIGYARVSTTDQDLDIQVAALKREGCTTIRSEKRSGTSTANREELRTVLDFLRKGDVLMVTHIDRLAPRTRRCGRRRALRRDRLRSQAGGFRLLCYQKRHQAIENTSGYEMASCYRLYFFPIDFDMNRHPQYPICENFKATDVRGLQRKSRPGLHFIPSPHSSRDSLKDIFPLRGAVGPDDDIAVPPRR
jgi:hypothetical protein